MPQTKFSALRPIRDGNDPPLGRGYTNLDVRGPRYTRLANIGELGRAEKGGLFAEAKVCLVASASTRTQRQVSLENGRQSDEG